MLERIKQKIKQNRFLFEELVKRDFTKKYKRTVLGMLWSILGPLMTLGVMALVFTQFFGRNMEHYVIYMFCGNLLFSYFKESTNGGMTALQANAKIFSKINVPKYMFVLSKNVSSLINFGINLCVLFVFCLFDGVTFTWKFLLLIYPVCCLVTFNLGMGLILSALYIMFKDLKYLYDIFTLLLMYVSAIFYSIDAYSLEKQYLFYLNPVYVYIRYFRKIILEGEIPQWTFHLLAAGYALAALALGAVIYKKKNYKFLYYICQGAFMGKIIEVKNVSVKYITGDLRNIGLKEFVIKKLTHQYRAEEFLAVNDVSFSLENGEMLGIIGTNGAGKSTLLKVITQIMRPSSGSVRVRGKVSALLELASGFDGDLNLKENAYLRGAMLGYTREFMNERYPEILKFSELEEFEQRPFKQLSSGMKSRIAFSIASMVDPEILILDEVLSVGDGAFREKSEAKMKEIIRNGKATILVSHSLDQIRRMCNKVLWLDHGRQIAFGETEKICGDYAAFLKTKELPKIQ